MLNELKLDLLHPVSSTVQAYLVTRFNVDFCRVHDCSEINFLCDESDDYERWDPNFSGLGLRTKGGPRRI
jgi:hypothetical protein